MQKHKTCPFLFVMSLSAAVSGFPQTIVKNPSKPLAANAGRTILLKEVLRIKDDGKGQGLNTPYDLQIGEDGSIYFYDNFSLYKYDKNGKFAAKLVRSGQGPGEASHRTTAVIMNQKIYVLALAPPKIMVFDLSGRLLEEVKTEILNNYGHFGLGGEMWIFRSDMLPAEERIPANGGEIDLPISLEKMTPDLKKTIRVAEFPRRYYFVNRGVWYEWSGFGFVAREPDKLFVHHTSEYRIVQYNVANKAVEKIISREYSRVARPDARPVDVGSGLRLPPKKYYDDILALLVSGDQLWAVTSTVDAEKNRLVDVFDHNGRYVDCFYWKFPGLKTRFRYPGSIALRDNFLYTIDEDADGFFSIGKYAISN